MSRQDESYSEDSIWKFGTSTWILILGLILFNVGCFVNPTFLNTFLYALDFRFWPWWYFVFIFIMVGFCIHWIRLRIRSQEFEWDPLDEESAIRFKRMAVVLSAEMIVAIIVHKAKVGYALIRPFLMWCMFGTFDWSVLIVLPLCLFCVCLTLYVLKEWFVTFFEQ